MNMAICLICDQHDGQKIEEFPDQRFCGCNYDRWLQRANNIKIKRIEESLKDNDKFLKSVLSDLSEDNVDIEQIQKKIKGKLNIKTCSVLEL